jgi:hypothetical protein
MKCLLLGLSLYLGCLTAQADQPQVVFHCSTTDNKEISLTRDVKSDTFTLVYGEDLTKPALSVTKPGSSLGYAVKRSPGNNLESTEVYINSLIGYITVGLTDYGDKGVEGYFSVEKPPADFILSAACVNSTVVEEFRNPNTTVFENMTEVDDY